MKKQYKLLIFAALFAFCLETSPRVVHAESLIIPSTNTINQYLKYRSGCSTNLTDCMSANNLENAVQSDIRAILGSLAKPETDLQKLEKAREQLQKDSDASYKQLQDSLKSLSSQIDTNIKSGFTCVQPSASCTEDNYQRIQGNAIANGLMPDTNELARCRSQIDQYNQKLQEYNQCQQNYINQKIDHSAETEYQTQKIKYDRAILEKKNYCKNKEGYYSDYNNTTGQCVCVTGATYIKGWCHSDAQVHLDNFLHCVQNRGVLATYDPKTSSCSCGEGSVFDKRENTCVPTTEHSVTMKTTSAKSGENPFLAILGLSQNKKISTENQKAESTIAPTNVPIEIKTDSNVVSETPVNSVQKSTFWQKIKHSISRMKFW